MQGNIQKFFNSHRIVLRHLGANELSSDGVNNKRRYRGLAGERRIVLWESRWYGFISDTLDEVQGNVAKLPAWIHLRAVHVAVEPGRYFR